MSAASLSDARIGQLLRGKYRLERVLGAGGMATVYAATHRNRRKFALKLLHPELSAHAEIRARFQREGYVANSVGHPGAVAVLDDDVAEDGSAFLVMELLEGTTVDELCQRHGGVLPPHAACAMGDQLLDVLVAAHGNGILHRDLKPANLFLTRDGALKVLDFGIARLRDGASASMTQTGAVMGTPGFMSPEQARGLGTELDVQADLWSTAATLFTLLSGQLVHEGDNAQMLLVNLLTQPARPLASVAPSVPALIAQVVDRALAFDKAARFPDAQSMRRALQEAARTSFGHDLQAGTPRMLADLLRSEAGAGRQAVESRATLASHGRRVPARARWLAGGVAAALSVLGLFYGFSPPRQGSDAGRASEAPAPPAAPPALPPPPQHSDGPAPSPGARAEQAGSASERAASTERASAGIDPRAAPPAARAEPPRPTSRDPATAKSCARMLERQSLGEQLSPEESAFFGQRCRN